MKASVNGGLPEVAHSPFSIQSSMYSSSSSSSSSRTSSGRSADRFPVAPFGASRSSTPRSADSGYDKSSAIVSHNGTGVSPRTGQENCRVQNEYRQSRSRERGSESDVITMDYASNRTRSETTTSAAADAIPGFFPAGFGGWNVVKSYEMKIGERRTVAAVATTNHQPPSVVPVTSVTVATPNDVVDQTDAEAERRKVSPTQSRFYVSFNCMMQFTYIMCACVCVTETHF